MFNYGIDKDLNILLSFPDQARPLILKYGLRTILGSTGEKFKNIKEGRGSIVVRAHPSRVKGLRLESDSMP